MSRAMNQRSVAIGQPARQVGQQPRLGVHVPHHVAHLVKRLGRRLDDQVDPVVEQRQLGIGDDARDLDQRIALDIESCHLAVDPNQPVVHSNKVKGKKHRAERARAPPRPARSSGSAGWPGNVAFVRADAGLKPGIRTLGSARVLTLGSGRG
jgi:hypothetical protein